MLYLIQAVGSWWDIAQLKTPGASGDQTRAKIRENAGCEQRTLENGQVTLCLIIYHILSYSLLHCQPVINLINQLKKTWNFEYDLTAGHCSISSSSSVLSPNASFAPQLKHYWKAPLCCQHLPHPLPPLVHPNWHQISIVNTQGTARNEHRGLRPPANFLFQSQDDWMLAKVLHKPALSKPNRKANYCAT